MREDRIPLCELVCPWLEDVAIGEEKVMIGDVVDEGFENNEVIDGIEDDGVENSEPTLVPPELRPEPWPSLGGNCEPSPIF
jgi:hypothetical protein